MPDSGQVCPGRPASTDTCLTSSSPAPLRLKVYLRLSRSTPKSLLRTPRAREASQPGNRPLPTQLSPPPAGSFHFLTAKSPRGAPLPPPPLRPPDDSARTASLPAPPARVRPAQEFLLAIGSRERQLRLASPIGWALLSVRRKPATASAPLKSRSPIGEDCVQGAGGEPGPAAFGQSQQPSAGREGGGGNIWPAPPRACVVRPPAPPPRLPPAPPRHCPPARAPRSLLARSLPRCVWQAAAAAGLLPWGAVESGASSLRRAPPAASGGGRAGGGRGSGRRSREWGAGGPGGREGGPRRRKPTKSGGGGGGREAEDAAAVGTR